MREADRNLKVEVFFSPRPMSGDDGGYASDIDRYLRDVEVRG